MRYREFSKVNESAVPIRRRPRLLPRSVQSALIQRYLVDQLVSQSQKVRPTAAEIEAAIDEFARLQRKADLDYYAAVSNYRRKIPKEFDL